jgi:hypothetical protein
LANAAFIAWKLIVNKAIKNTIIIGIMKNKILKWILKYNSAAITVLDGFPDSLPNP